MHCEDDEIQCIENLVFSFYQDVFALDQSFSGVCASGKSKRLIGNGNKGCKLGLDLPKKKPHSSGQFKKKISEHFHFFLAA